MWFFRNVFDPEKIKEKLDKYSKTKNMNIVHIEKNKFYVNKNSKVFYVLDIDENLTVVSDEGQIKPAIINKSELIGDATHISNLLIDFVNDPIPQITDKYVRFRKGLPNKIFFLYGYSLFYKNQINVQEPMIVLKSKNNCKLLAVMTDYNEIIEIWIEDYFLGKF